MSALTFMRQVGSGTGITHIGVETTSSFLQCICLPVKKAKKEPDKKPCSFSCFHVSRKAEGEFSIHIHTHFIFFLSYSDALVVCGQKDCRAGCHRAVLIALQEIRGYPIVGLAKIFHNSFNWIYTFSMGINENN